MRTIRNKKETMFIVIAYGKETHQFFASRVQVVVFSCSKMTEKTIKVYNKTITVGGQLQMRSTYFNGLEDMVPVNGPISKPHTDNQPYALSLTLNITDFVRHVIDVLGPHLQEGQRRNALSLEMKILSTLAFFATDSYQRCVGQNFHQAVEQSRMSRIISEVIDAMVNLLQDYVKFPQIQIERNAVKERFRELFNFPGIIGAIDCTHIAIVAPKTEDPVRPGIAYYNRKGFYSLNVQMICDANLLNCNARFPGATHDSAIWNLSAVKRHMEENYLANQLNSSWLIGDSGYPLQPWLLTLIENAEPNSPEGRYTRQHILARNVIERCFGVLKQRFRCLRVLHYTPQRAARILLSCVILHNIAVEDGALPLDDVELDEGAEGAQINQGQVHHYLN